LADDETLDERLSLVRERLSHLAECGFPGPTHMDLRYVEDVDWLTEWRKHHKPMLIGNRLLICPSWEDPFPAEDRVMVVLDPGMAFGTGSHPSTRLCLEALEQVLRPGMVVADVGTGSGILAIAAAKLGAARVYASEIDSLPRKIAAENAARNGVADRITIMTPDDLADLSPVCDLVLCNIIAETIAHLAPLLAAMTRANGTLIASGIVEERLHLVVEALSQAGMRIADVRSDDVWRAVIARHTPPDE
jgi:ribosomal protein L11 methyltransferase